LSPEKLASKVQKTVDAIALCPARCQDAASCSTPENLLNVGVFPPLRRTETEGREVQEQARGEADESEANITLRGAWCHAVHALESCCVPKRGGRDWHCTMLNSEFSKCTSSAIDCNAAVLGRRDKGTGLRKGLACRVMSLLYRSSLQFTNTCSEN